MVDKKTIRSIFFAAVGCIVVYWLLHETERVWSVWNTVRAIMAPFAIGAALAFILNVPMRAIERSLRLVKRPGLRRGMAMVLTLIAIVLVLVGVFYLLVPQIGETIQALGPKMVSFVRRIEVWFWAFLEENPQLMNWITANTELENFDWTGIIQKMMQIFGDSMAVIANSAYSAVGSITGAIVNTVIGVVFAVYCLIRKEILARQGRRLIYSVLPERFCDETVRILRLTNSTFSNFISGQCLEACILGCLFAVAMAIFRMPYIPLISVLVAVTALVPVVGAFVGCIFGAFFILVNNPIQAVWFVGLFLVLQQIEGNIIYPRVVGTSIGLPGMWVLVAVSIGGELMGIGGMFLMIPVVSVVYTLLREFTARRVSERQIDPDKLRDHPPELKSKFKEKRARKREQKLLRQMKQLAEKHTRLHEKKE